MARKTKSKASDEDPFEVVVNELHRFRGPYKEAGAWYMVCCPFHDDSTPSCGIYLRRDDPNRKFGSFNCLGCSEGKGNWNKFAEKTGLRTIREWDTKERVVGDVVSINDDEELLGKKNTTLKELLNAMQALEAETWPDYINWRGIPGKVISAIGGLIISDSRNEDIGVLFPVKVHNRVRGGVKAVYEKRYKSQLGYITSKGSWVKTYGLFPFDYVKHMTRVMSYDFVILVEGPRDALRLIKLGIPALAILGSQNFGKSKAQLLTSLGISTIYAMPDNDKAGKDMWLRLKDVFKTHDTLTLRRLKLPKDKDEHGKLIKMDPFSAPKYVINALKDVLEEKHDWVKFKEKNRDKLIE